MAVINLETSNGLEILANILRHCSAQTNRNILFGLQNDPECAHLMPKLRRQIVMFDDLAFADSRGIQKLLRLITLKDLALALKNCNESIVKNFGMNMSKHSLDDLKEEIKQTIYASNSDTELAQDRIMAVAAELINSKEMYIERPGEEMLY